MKDSKAERFAGYTLIDRVVGYDGVKYPVYTDKESGMFVIRNLPVITLMTGKDLPKLKREALAHIRLVVTSKFVPVIVVKKDQFNRERHSLKIDYERYFVGNLGTGNEIWKSFLPKGFENMIRCFGSHDPEDDTLEGSAGSEGHRGGGTREGEIILPYTPERWKALRMITKGMEELNRRLEEVMGNSKSLDSMLSRMSKDGMPFLLGQKEKEDK